ncbi:hypothetical protein CFOL_v3_28719 [Cephalotus follicularis]|uniref:Uncharacterized protein n=1 Tax=Cephalotus follicularis TaxID=3775 RepID=A0A1Q3CYQ9_CEPFO|nr:hypothetical protein CFOL_v3_28719 [Cephalotus follicularis]
MGSKSFTLGKSFSKGFLSSKPEATSQDKGKAKEGKVSKEKATLSKGDKKCFKCHGYGHFQANYPNKRVITLQDIEEIEGGSQEDENSNDDEEIMANPKDGEILVIRCTLHAKLIEPDNQRKNIFQSRCTIKEKVCFLIINSRSCTNVAATTLVEKLGLPTIVHPSPYKLQWLSNGSQLKVTQQVLLSFSIGKKYKD